MKYFISWNCKNLSMNLEKYVFQNGFSNPRVKQERLYIAYSLGLYHVSFILCIRSVI